MTFSDLALFGEPSELIVEFLGASQDAAHLSLVSRQWNEHVRVSSIWCAPFAAVAPLLFGQLWSEQTARRNVAGEISFTTDWRGALAQELRVPRSLRSFATQNDFTPCRAVVAASRPPSAQGVNGFYRATIERLAAARRRGSLMLVALSTLLVPHPSEKAAVQPKHRKVVVLGPARSGKRQVLRRLTHGTVRRFVPLTGGEAPLHVAVGCGCLLHSWDAHAFAVHKDAGIIIDLVKTAKGIMYVVDSSDPAAIQEARPHLAALLLLPPFARGAPLCLVATKQDRPGALAPQAVAAALGLGPDGQRPLLVVGANAADAASAEHLRSALTWLRRTSRLGLEGMSA